MPVINPLNNLSSNVEVIFENLRQRRLLRIFMQKYKIMEMENKLKKGQIAQFETSNTVN